MSTEKAQKLTEFARQHGHPDLESLYAAMDYEKNSDLIIIAQMGLNRRSRNLNHIAERRFPSPGSPEFPIQVPSSRGMLCKRRIETPSVAGDNPL